MKRLLILLGVCGAWLSLGTPLEAQQRCLADSARATRLVRRVIELAADTTPPAPMFRDSVLNIPAQVSSSVALVTNETVCTAVSDAYAAEVPAMSGIAPRALYVISVGAYFVAVDPAARFGEWLTALVLDAQYHRRSAGPFGM